MKKLVFFSIIFAFVLLLTGCGKKSAISTSKFRSIVESSGYTFTDDYDNYSHRGIEIKMCLYDDEEKSEYDFEDFELLEDFLLKNHLDYRGLIPMGLALPATEEMYN